MYSTCLKCENVNINTLRTGILKHLSRQAYYSKIPVTLILNMKTVDQSILKQLSGQAFFSQGPCDLDL
jgi:hypothetical protein